MSKSLPLYSKLALTITGVGLIVSMGFVALAVWSSDRYHREVTQQLHKGLAQYVLEHLPGPLFVTENGEDIVNNKVLKAIAINTMTINPSVEVYLLDGTGRVLGHALPERSVMVYDIDISAIHHYLEYANDGPVLGQNPRETSMQSIFSAAPVSFNGDMKGYLYVVLASHEASSLASQLSGSHIARLTLGAVLALLLFLGLSSYLSFKRITTPLQKLSQQVKAYRKQSLDDGDNLVPEGDEVGELADAFTLMQKRIQEQFDQLAETDKIRRELISNVSHDLRTPLASMQGYLETLLLKGDSLSEEKVKHYIQIAHRHGKHLNELISQLFVLSKLDSGKVEPEYEVFSLTELLYDVKQDYELQAEKKDISLNVNVPQQNALVKADISLIQRVLQNLIDNAMKHTPENGRIDLNLDMENGQVKLSVKDSGVGIKREDLPYVFDRFYQSSDNKGAAEKASIGAGLGLSIVKKLELHGVLINVDSELNAGTCFQFSLPKPA